MHIQEYSGSGFIPGVPASIAMAPCRILLDDNGQILEVAGPGQLFRDEQPPEQPPDARAQSDTGAQLAKGKRG